ncbi:NAD(P)-dependent dehydrogenase (short-subunit alcohol dehydrogenase family) [Novosphingobium sp. PhB165]|uniref:SDR family NAD(P)-dependent oxidoreductase n=1 Tax=Novosphingobium sp. PhB165 TaxID=2485105 RepID=UPI001051A1D2|nr:SDR family NAD(P)-dependent oxidoreductase [Novosphingobium sp. PhB165]TCM21706.1 NAD(P)-dependent dehydrogenase (short-subunit alcohol dehydrogenase family) [Novosphingobium sp. PhB165]
MTQQAPIALVTGASRGAGRGIALALGSHGYTVYVTGRSQAPGGNALPGTIYETAEAVTAAGGRGVAVACDHSDDAQVAALFERLLADEGRIDLLVNNAAAIHDELTQPGEFWEKPLKLVDLINVGVRSGYVASWHAAKAMGARNHGLIVFTSASGAAHYSLGPAYGAHKAGMDKMAFDMASDFRHAGRKVAALSIWMGALMTDRLKAIMVADPVKYGHLEGHCESPEFTGHVIHALYGDQDLAALSGRTLVGAEIARKYGLTDGGRVPPTAAEIHGVEPLNFHPAEIR